MNKILLFIKENETKIIELKKKSYALKFCNTCKIFRPLRTHHCRVCDVCIEDMGYII